MTFPVMPRVKSLGTRSLLIAAFCLFLTGCATTPPGLKETLFRLYQRQQYTDCLAAIEKMKNPKLAKEDQAELVLMEALCHEEMNHVDEANHLYRSVIEKFGQTESAQRAARRLIKLESDQTEHFSIDSAPGSWQRLDKQWNSMNLRERYISTTDSRQSIIILAKDLGPERGSITAALGQVKAALRADAQQVELKAIDESSQEGLFEFTARNPGRIRRENVEGEVQIGMKIRHSSGLGRVILTNKRMHVLLYSDAVFALEKEEKEKWLEALRKARLVKGTAQSSGNP
jgi:hypothetical protein